MRFISKTLLIMSICFGMLLVYYLWPDNSKLPLIDKVDSFTLYSIQDEQYNSSNSKVKLVAFFYTNCPNVCPLTMNDLESLQTTFKEMGVFATDLEFVAITLDPEFDTPERIKKYSQAFNADYEGWKWLRGSKEETAQIARDFKMVYQKSKDGFVAHNTTMYLLDNQNRVRAIYEMANVNKPIDRDQIINDVKQLLP